MDDLIGPAESKSSLIGGSKNRNNYFLFENPELVRSRIGKGIFQCVACSMHNWESYFPLLESEFSRNTINVSFCRSNCRSQLYKKLFYILSLSFPNLDGLYVKHVICTSSCLQACPTLLYYLVTCLDKRKKKKVVVVRQEVAVDRKEVIVDLAAF